MMETARGFRYLAYFSLRDQTRYVTEHMTYHMVDHLLIAQLIVRPNSRFMA